jgi:hypothetical protein
MKKTIILGMFLLGSVLSTSAVTEHEAITRALGQDGPGASAILRWLEQTPSTSVCGGREASHLRSLLCEICQTNDPEKQNWKISNLQHKLREVVEIMQMPKRHKSDDKESSDNSMARDLTLSNIGLACSGYYARSQNR